MQESSQVWKECAAADQSANEAAGDTRCGRTEGSCCGCGSVTHLRGDAPAVTPANGVATPNSLSRRGRRRSPRLPMAMLRPAASLAAAQVRTQQAGGLLTQLLTSSPQRCAASDWLTQRTRFSSALCGVFLTRLKQTQLKDLCSVNYCTLKSLWQMITGPIQY